MLSLTSEIWGKVLLMTSHHSVAIALAHVLRFSFIHPHQASKNDPRCAPVSLTDIQSWLRAWILVLVLDAKRVDT